jgi:hypothetical protein
LVLYARARFLPLPWRPRLAPGGRQVAPLVFSAWDSATPERRHGGGEQRRQHSTRATGPCQVTSQVIVAVAWNAPPGCPALELVSVCPDPGLSTLE